MEGLYHQTNKMVHEVQSGLGRLERAKGKAFYTKKIKKHLHAEDRSTWGVGKGVYILGTEVQIICLDLDFVNTRSCKWGLAVYELVFI